MSRRPPAHTQPGGQHIGTRRWSVELEVEVVQEPSNRVGVIHRRQSWGPLI